jgi:hypothetical protein
VVGDHFYEAHTRLGQGPPCSFSETLDPALPRMAAGSYTIWDDGGRRIYAGMAVVP